MSKVTVTVNESIKISSEHYFTSLRFKGKKIAGYAGSSGMEYYPDEIGPLLRETVKQIEKYTKK